MTNIWVDLLPISSPIVRSPPLGVYVCVSKKMEIAFYHHFKSSRKIFDIKMAKENFSLVCNALCYLLLFFSRKCLVCIKLNSFYIKMWCRYIYHFIVNNITLWASETAFFKSIKKQQEKNAFYSVSARRIYCWDIDLN